MDPRDFQDGDWESALTAATAASKKTGLRSTLTGLVTKTTRSGGSGNVKMGVDVGEGVYRSSRSPDSLTVRPEDGINTMCDAWNTAALKHAHSDCMGWRDILKMTSEGGKEKYVMGAYKWISYRRAHERSLNFGRGLVGALGVKKGDIVNFFADTKLEWQVGCQGAAQFGVVVSTTYANLGADAVAYGIQQTDAPVIFTDADLVSVVNDILGDCPTVKHVIFSRDKRPAGFAKSDAEVKALITAAGVQVHSFEEVEELGKTEGADLEIVAVKPEDTCVIMYTSGSTGNPKGVVISHANIVACVGGVGGAIPGIENGKEVYIAYLPAAHILELSAEVTCLWNGSAIGYGSTKTITDASVCIEPGACKGDANELRPTLMAAVPAIMDKIRAGVRNKMDSAGGVVKRLFDTAFKAKAKALAQGNDTPFWNGLLFDKIRTTLLGGRVRYMLSGGGPLSKETQDFMNVVFCCPVGQGYGLTETVGAATTVWPTDRTSGRVGAPISSMQIRLVDWEEGGYYATPSSAPAGKQHPNPRGEVLLGGPQITMGYYKEPAKTEEAFFEDADGCRWLRTGDVGEMYPDGVLAIVDRKKDLVKLSGGEYVSYGKLEPLLRNSDYVDNALVYCDPMMPYCVAVVQRAPGAKPVSDKVIFDDLMRILKKEKCARFELPKKIFVETDIVWGPENDLCTAALKLKRRNLQEHYETVLADLYKK